MSDEPQDPNPTGSAMLPDLPGVDLEAGLRVSRHNHAVYRRLLIKFRDSWSDYRRAFEDAFAAEGEARHLAHNLKGVAANLGIAEVQRLAGELEAIVSEAPQAAEAADHRDRLYDELDRVLTGLRILD